jgi:hypothetical protein
MRARSPLKKFQTTFCSASGISGKRPENRLASAAESIKELQRVGKFSGVTV